jgi:hypothetical protein
MKRSLKPFPRDIIFVWIATLYLLSYCILLHFENTKPIALVMLGFAPLLLVAMVYTVLKHGKYTGPGLGNDEFGYLDKNKNDLGTF